MAIAAAAAATRALARLDCGVYVRHMEKIFDMDDRARLPWRFFGATMTVLARL